MKGMLKMVLVIFATATTAITSAQLRGPELIDSFVKALPAMREDSNKINALYKIGGFNLGGDLAKAIANGEQALKISEKLDWKPGIAKANILLGIAWRRSADYNRANKYLMRSLEVYTGLNDKFGMASCEINIANVHSDKGDIASAMEYYYKAIDVYQELGKKEEVAGLLNNIGLLYFDEGDTDKALEIYLRALKLQEEAGTTRSLGMLLDNIGLAYISKKEYQQGISTTKGSLWAMSAMLT
jgi:tetratricopeptide (TPR) repeat protein